MANKSNLSGCFNSLNKNDLKWYVEQYAIPASLNPIIPKKDTPIYPFVPGKIGVYTRMFDYCNYRLPLTKFLVEVLLFHEVHLSQMNPFGQVRKINACCYTWITSSLKDWKDRFFLVDDRCIPSEMTWRLKRSRLLDPLPKDFAFDKKLYAALIREARCVEKYPEHILVMGRISTIWSEPAWYPTLKWNGEAMGLKDALRLKSFDSTELDVRTTKTPKGDPPYLKVVQENLYPISKPTIPVYQGGSGSAPSIRTVNLASVQATTVDGGDKGKGTGSSEARGSGSKIGLYGSEHLSVEDEGVNAEEEEDEGDDGGA
ncbi:hypothetical protein Hanom_Chr15g01379261 [Helianthus anomalus]